MLPPRTQAQNLARSYQLIRDLPGMLQTALKVAREREYGTFDHLLLLLEPTAYLIIDNFALVGYIAYALLYPIALGTACAGLGFWVFKRSDLP